MAAFLLVLVLQTQMTGSLAGRVRNFTGQPVPGAVISYGSASHHTIADSLGRYHFDSVPVGRVDLTAWGLGYTAARADATVTEGQELRVNFFLVGMTSGVIPAVAGQAMGSLVVSLRDSANHPVTRPMVYLTANPRRRSVGDSLGEYRIDSVPAGRVAVSTRVLGFYMRVDTVAVRPGEETRVTFVLHPTPPLAPVVENDRTTRLPRQR